MSQTVPTMAQATTYAENYILYGDQSRAFRVTFPDSKGSPESNHSKASKFHKTVMVQSRIAELQAGLKKQTEEEFYLSVNDIKKKLVEAAESGLDRKVDMQGNSIPISIPGAVSALAEINKMDGNHAAVRLALGGDDKAPPISIENFPRGEYIKARKEMLESDEC